MKEWYDKYFTQGYICAVCKMIQMHGCTSEVIELFGMCRIEKEDFDRYGIDEFDREVLLKHWDSLQQGRKDHIPKDEFIKHLNNTAS